MAEDMNIKALLCDADDLALEETLPLLREIGFSCAYVQNISDALAGAEKPDVILLNSQVTGGREALGQLRRAFPDAAILVVARCRSLAAAVEFFRAGLSLIHISEPT
ncbi:MAG: hypothetical protein N3A66_11215, partial [Planctomycetota bacterium]|nr:hypothetical protein [Planctomycetota bacterium]